METRLSLTPGQMGPDNDMVGVRISYSETQLPERVKDADGIWRARQRLWQID